MISSPWYVKYKPAVLYNMLSEWILAFKSILDDHQKGFLEADGKKTRSRVARKVRKAILKAHHDREQDGVKDLTLPDPSSLKKVL